VLTPRQTRLAQELAADRGYASGKREFRGTVTADDAVAIAEAIHESVDEAAAARAAAAEQLGRPLACGAGCTGCCEELVMVFEPEALRVARWLERPENAGAKEAFLAAFDAWKGRVGDAPDRLAAAFASGDVSAHLREHTAQWQRRILCAFNRDGLCTVYEVRPLLCRNAHALDTPARCYGDEPSGKAAVRLDSDDVDRFIDHARATLRAVHHAIGGKRLHPASLCEAVHALVTASRTA
jgi:hypothetical protein